MENGSPRATQRVWGERTSTESRLLDQVVLNVASGFFHPTLSLS